MPTCVLHIRCRSCILPIGLLFAIVLWSGNAAYLYLSVSFIQMLKVRGAAGCVQPHWGSNINTQGAMLSAQHTPDGGWSVPGSLCTTTTRTHMLPRYLLVLLNLCRPPCPWWCSLLACCSPPKSSPPQWGPTWLWWAPALPSHRTVRGALVIAGSWTVCVILASSC